MFRRIPFPKISSKIYRSAQGPRPESAPRSALSAFEHLSRSAPNSAFGVLFGVFEPQECLKALKKHSLGHSEAGAQKHSKSTAWGTFRPGPLGTPANGGRDRNICEGNLILLTKEAKVLEIAVGAVLAPTRFSLVRNSPQDLVADGKALVRKSGVEGGGQDLILISRFLRRCLAVGFKGRKGREEGL